MVINKQMKNNENNLKFNELLTKNFQETRIEWQRVTKAPFLSLLPKSYPEIAFFGITKS